LQPCEEVFHPETPLSEPATRFTSNNNRSSHCTIPDVNLKFPYVGHFAALHFKIAVQQIFIAKSAYEPNGIPPAPGSSRLTDFIDHFDFQQSIFLEDILHHHLEDRKSSSGSQMKESSQQMCGNSFRIRRIQMEASHGNIEVTYNATIAARNVQSPRDYFHARNPALIHDTPRLIDEILGRLAEEINRIHVCDRFTFRLMNLLRIISFRFVS
jgi:hypothetical protein